MTQALVVFHSRTGYCRMLAESLCKKHGWQLGEVTYLHGHDSLARYACDALLRRSPQIRYDGPDPERFRAIVLIAPVRTLGLCPLMRAFARSLRRKRDDVALLACSDSGSASNALAEIERLLEHRTVASLALRPSDVEAGLRMSDLQLFATEVDTRACLRSALQLA